MQPVSPNYIVFFSFTFGTEAESISKETRMSGDTVAAEEASSSGLNNDAVMVTSEETAEATISQSDSENKDPSSNTQFFKRKRGRPSKHFLRNKYKKYINRK